LAKRSQIMLQRLGVAKHPRKRSAVRLSIREPVEKEHDMARLFLHDPVEDVEQRRRHGQVLATELEQAERAERVQAFFESEVHDRLQYIRGNLDPDLAQGEPEALHPAPDYP